MNILAKYTDGKGRIYFVRGELGEPFRAYYIDQKSDKPNKLHSVRQLKWRDNIYDAQVDLGKLAEQKGWKEI
jgi:hypothetical protein